MFIQIQETPNPNTLKFIPGIAVTNSNKVFIFNSKEECKESKLAESLFDIENVKSVFFGSDFISITKDDSCDWYTLKTLVVAKMIDYITAGMPVVNTALVSEISNTTDHLRIEDQEIIKQIIEVIETKVRPSVAEDGGDVQFHSYENGVVYLTMHGACSGCPSATITLKNGIENMLQYYVPEVIRVEQI